MDITQRVYEEEARKAQQEAGEEHGKNHVKTNQPNGLLKYLLFGGSLQKMNREQ